MKADPREEEVAPHAVRPMHRLEASLWIVIPIAIAIVIVIFFWP